MTVIPAHHEGWCAVITQHLKDLAVTIGLACVMPFDYQAIAWACS
jgi:hypothetical protein